MSDETITRLDPPVPKGGAKAQLVVVEGASRGIVTDLVQAEVKIGRRPENDVCLPSASVSKLHCRIVREGGRFAVEDLGSTNGISVNGLKVDSKGRRMLCHGDHITVGDHLLLFRQDAGASDQKAAMGTITFDAAKVRAEVDDLLKDFPRAKP